MSSTTSEKNKDTLLHHARVTQQKKIRIVQMLCICIIAGLLAVITWETCSLIIEDVLFQKEE